MLGSMVPYGNIGTAALVVVAACIVVLVYPSIILRLFALIFAPLPAALFMWTTADRLPVEAQGSEMLRTLLIGVTCYLAVWLGVAAVRLSLWAIRSDMPKTASRNTGRTYPRRGSDSRSRGRGAQ